MIGEWGKNAKIKKKKNRMKEHSEERRKSKLDDENYASATDISHSNSASFLAVVTASISANEMTSSRYFKLGVSPKWTAQPALTQPCPNCGDTTIPSWRDKISVENHHDDNSRRPADRKPVQRIQEDGRTLRNDEEEACQGVCQFVAGVRRRQAKGSRMRK